jgi:hypothetical protein
MARDINIDDTDITRDIEPSQLEEVKRAMEEFERDDKLKAM